MTDERFVLYLLRFPKIVLKLNTLVASDSIIYFHRRKQCKYRRGYFKKTKRPGVERFVKSALFFKKKKKFSWFESKVSKTTSSLGEFDLYLPFWIIQALFCQTKVPFHWSKEPFSKNNLIRFFILNKEFNSSFKYFYHILRTKWGICYKIWKLIVKTNTDQTSTFSRFGWTAWAEFSRNIYLR